MKLCLVLCWGMLALCFSGLAAASDQNWALYKANYVTPQGRVVDTGNGGISHSEGQGYGLLLAFHNDDQQTFEQIWAWSKKHLGRHDLPLFAWKYDPNTVPHVADQNDASDGDLLIAWALYEAGKAWQNKNYTNASQVIRTAIVKHLVTSFGGYDLLLPGMKGFVHHQYVDINLSYWVMPALQAFAQQDGGAWRGVMDSAHRLLQKSAFGVDKLPTDWIRVTSNGVVSASPNWPPRFGFDAVRIPLYFSMAGLSNALALEPIKQFWQKTQGKEPAWVNVKTGERSAYSASQGVKAIIALLKDQSLPSKLDKNASYYSASLFLLAHLAKPSR